MKPTKGLPATGVVEGALPPLVVEVGGVLTGVDEGAVVVGGEEDAEPGLHQSDERCA